MDVLLLTTSRRVTTLLEPPVRARVADHYRATITIGMSRVRGSRLRSRNEVPPELTGISVTVCEEDQQSGRRLAWATAFHNGIPKNRGGRSVVERQYSLEQASSVWIRTDREGTLVRVDSRSLCPRPCRDRLTFITR